MKKERLINYMLSGNAMITHLTDGFIKKTQIYYKT